MKTSSQSFAFTLIELLVVIVIIAILAAMTFTGLSKARTKGNQTASMNNLRQWGTALNASLTDFDNRLPSTGMSGDKVSFTDKDAWFNRLPAYINEVPLSDPLATSRAPKFGQKSVWINPATRAEEFKAFMNVPEQRLFSYAMNGWLSTAAEPTLPRIRIEAPGSTVFMSEQGEDKSEIRTETLRTYFGSNGNLLNDKEGYAHFLFCDGRIELVRRDTFDPRFAPKTNDPIDAEMISPGFSYVPFKGAVAD